MSKGSSPKKQQLIKGVVGLSPLATLSDGVITVDQDQAAKAAASVIIAASQQQQRIAGDGQEADPSAPGTSMSQLPLCDANHSPSTTKRYYNQHSSASFNQQPQPEDVWQRQDEESHGESTTSNNNNVTHTNNLNYSEHCNSQSNGSAEANSSLSSDAANGESHINSINSAASSESTR